MTTAPIPAHVLIAERQFFDREAQAQPDEQLVIPPEQVRRYQLARPDPGNTPKEALFARLLPLAGKRVLDYGCGHGENSILLAACSARVCGFDLSPGSIALARRRAEAHGLADRIRFDVAAAGQTPYPPGSFDVIAGFAILHHLHQNLGAIYAEIGRLLAPRGVAAFIEPVANSRPLAAGRRWVPIPTGATPDERQLRYEDLWPLSRYFDRMELLHFHGLTRAERLLGEWCGPALRRLDTRLQQAVPRVKPLYGTVVVVASRGF